LAQSLITRQPVIAIHPGARGKELDLVSKVGDEISLLLSFMHLYKLIITTGATSI